MSSESVHASERGDEATVIRVEPLGERRFKATVNGVEVVAERVRVETGRVTFYAKNLSVARVETAEPAGKLPAIVARAVDHDEPGTWRAAEEVGR